MILERHLITSDKHRRKSYLASFSMFFPNFRTQISSQYRHLKQNTLVFHLFSPSFPSVFPKLSISFSQVVHLFFPSFPSVFPKFSICFSQVFHHFSSLFPSVSPRHRFPAPPSAPRRRSAAPAWAAPRAPQRRWGAEASETWARLSRPVAPGEMGGTGWYN